MKTISLKVSDDLEQTLDELARRRRSSRSAVVREAIEKLAKGGRRSVTAIAGDLVGSLEGPGDLSTNRRYMADFGK